MDYLILVIVYPLLTTDFWILNSKDFLLTLGPFYKELFDSTPAHLAAKNAQLIL